MGNTIDLGADVLYLTMATGVIVGEGRLRGRGTNGMLHVQPLFPKQELDMFPIREELVIAATPQSWILTGRHPGRT